MINKETLENVKAVQNSYDETPYKSKTFYYTQPGRQQMVLKLLGFLTPKLENARVLEIGCSFGGNIIPFALENPKADIVGIDLSGVQIDEGNRIIEYLGLENIRLIHQNVLEFDKKLGKFDYIICHGVFSWVNEEVQRGILNVIKNHLTENGSAILSYNTYPGWKNLEVARDVMLFRDEMLKNRGEQINESNAVKYGRGAIEFLSQFSILNEKIKNGITGITEKDDYYILHEYFEENNQPLYLYNFNKMLLEHGLIHVVDSDLMKTFPNISNEIEEKLTAECGNDNVAKEQYYDFLLDRQFRISIVTHEANKEKINISKDVRITDLKEIDIRGKYEKNKDGFYIIENNEIKDEEVSLILDILSENYPNTITIDELEKKVKEKNKLETNNVYANAVYLMYGKLVEAYSRKLTVKKEEKIKLNPKYKKYLDYFITNPSPVIALASYEGTVNYDTFNEYSGAFGGRSVGDIKGDGKMHYYGIGLLGKASLPANFYTEATVKMGKIKTDYETVLPNGVKVDYDVSRSYYGGHVGLGKIFEITDFSNIDIYSKVFFTRVGKKQVELNSERILLGESDSLKAKIGFKFSQDINDDILWFAGLAYDSEFKGKSNGYNLTYGTDIISPSMKGNTGTAEFGLKFKTQKGFETNLKFEGMVGKREGVAAAAEIMYKF